MSEIAATRLASSAIATALGIEGPPPAWPKLVKMVADVCAACVRVEKERDEEAERSTAWASEVSDLRHALAESSRHHAEALEERDAARRRVVELEREVEGRERKVLDPSDLHRKPEGYRTLYSDDAKPEAQAFVKAETALPWELRGREGWTEALSLGESVRVFAAESEVDAHYIVTVCNERRGLLAELRRLWVLEGRTGVHIDTVQEQEAGLDSTKVRP